MSALRPPACEPLSLLSPLCFALFALLAWGALGCSTRAGGLIRGGGRDAVFGYTPSQDGEGVSGRAICAHPSGDVIVAGSLHGETQFGATAARALSPSSALFVGRFTPRGHPRWLYWGDGIAADIAVDPGGGVFVAATLESDLRPISEPLPSREPNVERRLPLLYAFGPDGALRWVHRFPSFGYEERIAPHLAAAAPDGGVFIAGLLGPNYDRFIARFSATGERRWFKGFEMNGSASRLMGLSVGPEGDVLLAGEMHGSLQMDDLKRSAQDDHGFVAKLSGSEGRLRWLRLIGREGCSTQASAVAVNARAEVFVGGTTDCSAPLVKGAPMPRAPGIRPYVLRASAATGEPAWTREFSGSAKTFAFGFLTDLAIGEGGHPIALMYQSDKETVSYGSLVLTSGEGQPGLLLGLNRETGASLWSHVLRGEPRFEGDADVSPASLATDAQGRLLVTGGFTGEIDFGAAALESPSGVHEVCPEISFDEEKGVCPEKPYASSSMFVLRTRPGDAP